MSLFAIDANSETQQQEGSSIQAPPESAVKTDQVKEAIGLKARDGGARHMRQITSSAPTLTVQPKPEDTPIRPVKPQAKGTGLFPYNKH